MYFNHWLSLFNWDVDSWAISKSKDGGQTRSFQ